MVRPWQRSPFAAQGQSEGLAIQLQRRALISTKAVFPVATVGAPAVNPVITTVQLGIDASVVLPLPQLFYRPTAQALANVNSLGAGGSGHFPQLTLFGLNLTFLPIGLSGTNATTIGTDTYPANTPLDSSPSGVLKVDITWRSPWNDNMDQSFTMRPFSEDVTNACSVIVLPGVGVTSAAEQITPSTRAGVPRAYCRAAFPIRANGNAYPVNAFLPTTHPLSISFQYFNGSDNLDAPETPISCKIDYIVASKMDFDVC